MKILSVNAGYPREIEWRGEVVRTSIFKEPVTGFKVPLYPVIPLVFCAMCGFMLWKAVDYTFNPQYGPKFGNLVLAGLLVMAAGIPLYWVARKK